MIEFSREVLARAMHTTREITFWKFQVQIFHGKITCCGSNYQRIGFKILMITDSL